MISIQSHRYTFTEHAKVTTDSPGKPTGMTGLDEFSLLAEVSEPLILEYNRNNKVVSALVGGHPDASLTSYYGKSHKKEYRLGNVPK